MAGAAVMSAQAASRCGVGLIDLALPESVYPAAASAIRESVLQRGSRQYESGAIL